ncbi:MAG: 30S ribosomal protein S12 methylthiotransferase RimO [Oscillospiraceae bacterium]|nr:30S ribosomal protein S12 methylthiotransferase RimO [Oscillospiraceae bacterium]
MAIKVGMVSLGCPKNQMDSELMLAKLCRAGYEITPDSGLADVVIVNTCGFIEEAKRESIENILEFAALKKEGRVKKIVVTGCLAERYQQELAAELPECDVLLGLGANHSIAEYIKQAVAGERVIQFPEKSCWQLEGDRVLTTPDFYAYLRVGDGCDNRCSYCAIPAIRGPLRSRPLEALVEEAGMLARAGVRELILVAQDTTAYGKDFGGEPKLPELLEALCKIDGLAWIRLLYCYPQHITDRLLEVMAAQPKIVKYLDIPLQHVSRKVLTAMNRDGSAETLSGLMKRIRHAVPGIVLRTTVMVGFPGETVADFQELCGWLQQTRFERLGCFAFSPEEDTAAAELPGQIGEDEKQRRRDILLTEQLMILDAFNQSRVGTVQQVLAESYDRYAGCWFGRSGADAPEIDGKVFFTVPENRTVKPGDLIAVYITDSLDFDLMGECRD